MENTIYFTDQDIKPLIEIAEGSLKLQNDISLSIQEAVNKIENKEEKHLTASQFNDICSNDNIEERHTLDMLEALNVKNPQQALEEWSNLSLDEKQGFYKLSTEEQQLFFTNKDVSTILHETEKKQSISNDLAKNKKIDSSSIKNFDKKTLSKEHFEQVCANENILTAHKIAILAHLKVKNPAERLIEWMKENNTIKNPKENSAEQTKSQGKKQSPALKDKIKKETTNLQNHVKSAGRGLSFD